MKRGTQNERNENGGQSGKQSIVHKITRTLSRYLYQENKMSTTFWDEGDVLYLDRRLGYSKCIHKIYFKIYLSDLIHLNAPVCKFHLKKKKRERNLDKY